MNRSHRALALALLTVAGAAQALDYELGDTKFTLKNKFSTGVAWRLQDPNQALIGKLNIDGQKDLCERDNCISLNGNPEPNQRLVNALGSFFAVNGDNGDLNYKRYDIVAATNKLALDLTAVHGDLVGRVRGIGFYDPVNANFNTYHPDTNYQPLYTDRLSQQANIYAKGAKLYDAFVQYTADVAGHSVVATVGQQTIRWGESNLLAINSLSEINPPNANFLHMPGGEINEIFQPVPAALISTDVVDGVTADFLYQFGWKKVQPDASGSFYASNDIAGRGQIADITLGQFPEDPNRQYRLKGFLGLISSTSTTVYPYETKPNSQGQFGIKVNYNAEWLNGGTELGFYALNYHSRFPYASVISTDESCARTSTNAAAALVACNGFKGTLINAPNGREPLPIDTLKVFLEYPENIHMFGISFNTNALGLSISGEYSYRPNIPMQVQIPDVVYAGLQPAFPNNDIVVDPTSTTGAGSGLLGTINSLLGAQAPGVLAQLADGGASTLPAARHAIPSYLVAYRNLGQVGPNQYIAGYERMGMGQFDITAIKIWSSNPFGADQIILLSEAGFQHIVGMPSRDRLQIEAGSANDSHASGGADGSGLTNQNSCNDRITGTPSDYTCHLNPKQQTRFADSFAWGIRTLAKLEYNDVVFGWGFKPTVGFNWDIDGTAPSPTQNFVQGRMEFTLGTDVAITPALVGRLMYLGYAGGKAGENTIADRDNVALSFAYTF